MQLKLYVSKIMCEAKKRLHSEILLGNFFDNVIG
jgi:hypothetical protein